MLGFSLLTFVIGFISCFLGILYVLRILARAGNHVHGVDQPDGLRKIHDRPVPRLGGIGVFLAFAVLATVVWTFDSIPAMDSLPSLCLGATLMFLVGLRDDFKPLPAKFKLAAQILIALLMWYLGLRIDLFANPISGKEIQLSSFASLLISVAWLVAIPNVVNLADGMDGLAGGVGLFLFITLGIVGVLNEVQTGVGVLSFGLVGATLAFLVFNFPPAKIFLGDGGAYFIGFVIAGASLGTSQKSYIGASLTITLIALGVPILDTIFSFGRRILKGVPVMRADSGHIHHRLLLMGMSSGKVLFILYGAFVVLSVLALTTVFNESFNIWLSVGFLFLIMLIALRGLGYVRNFRSIIPDLKRVLGTRKSVKHAVLVTQALEMEIERTEDGADYWQMFEHELNRLNFSLPDGKNPGEIVFRAPFKGVSQWAVVCNRLDAAPAEQIESEQMAREAVASCFIAPLCLGIQKFGPPSWRGLEFSD